MVPTLATSRLWLRPLTLEDASATQKLFPEWEIVRYLSNTFPWPYPVDGARRFYQDEALPAMDRGEAWHWSLRLKTDPETVIGSISLTLGESDHRGFWLALPYHGLGLMSEACVPVTDFWFETLGQPVLRVPKARANEASRRISQKQGMRIVWSGEKDYIGGRMPADLWEITAEEWRRFRESCP